MISDELFFAFVSNSECETLYIGYGQMCPKGNYILVTLDPGQELLTGIWLGKAGPVAVIDVLPDFDPRRDLFVTPYQPDKRDLDDLSKFRIIGRSVLDPDSSLKLLEQMSVSAVEEALTRAEVEARNSGSNPKATYERIEQLHTMRSGMAIAVEKVKQMQHLRSTSDALRDKMKKLKGDA